MKKLILTSVLLLGLSGAACAGHRGGYVAFRVGPPPPRPAVVIGVAPRPGYVYADGYWDLRGRRDWVWVPGHWVRAPRPGATWAPGYWEPYRDNWRFRRGHWR